MSKEPDINKLIRSYKRRLQKLREEQATFGVSTPPHVLTEIEDIEEKLDELEMESSVSSSTSNFYGIIKDPELRAKISELALQLKDEINNVIDNLQFDPRPPGHKPTTIAPEIINYEVGTKPKYNLLYKIDDRRKIVSVLRIDPTYFS